jgi:hypothetical protein
MTHLIERLAELRRHLDHLYRLRPRVSSAELRVDLSLHNVLFSLLTVCQLVIDIAGELSSRRGLKYEDYTVPATPWRHCWTNLALVAAGYPLGLGAALGL